jgi:DNA-binding LytR/AlgR family response regulator
MKILIIEDENLLAKELIRTLLQIRNDVDIIGRVKGVAEGIKWFDQKVDVDLIISDIQLVDGTSFELFKKIEVPAPIIFTTAYDEYAIRAFKVNSIDYLLKPIDEMDLALALVKYDKIWAKKEPISVKVLDDLISKKNESTYKSRFLIRVGDQYKQVSCHDIGFFFAEGNTVYLVKKDGRKLIVDYSLDQIMLQLDPQKFFRINRHLLLNNTCITGIHKYFNSRLKLNIEPAFETDVLVTRSRVSEFLSWMNN